MSALNQAWLLALYYDQINGVVGFLPGGRGVCNTHTHTHLPGHTIQSDFLKGQNNNDYRSWNKHSLEVLLNLFFLQCIYIYVILRN